MPIYEYRCKACSHELEVIQKLSEEPLKFCPECGQPELTKLVSAAGFRLKGGGWYETDFKSGVKKKNLAGDQAAPAATTEAAKPAPAATETKTPAPSAS
jgi:putative FmdB family regulatory protein